MKRQKLELTSCKLVGKRQKWANSKDISMLKWIILDSFQDPPYNKNSSKVANKKQISIIEAPLVMIIAVT